MVTQDPTFQHVYKEEEGEEEDEEMNEGEEVMVSSLLMMPMALTTRGGVSVVEMVTGRFRGC
jgi:hypothetical protein